MKYDFELFEEVIILMIGCCLEALVWCQKGVGGHESERVLRAGGGVDGGTKERSNEVTAG